MLIWCRIWSFVVYISKITNILILEQFQGFMLVRNVPVDKYQGGTSLIYKYIGNWIHKWKSIIMTKYLKSISSSPSEINVLSFVCYWSIHWNVWLIKIKQSKGPCYSFPLCIPISQTCTHTHTCMHTHTHTQLYITISKTATSCPPQKKKKKKKKTQSDLESIAFKIVN